MRLHLATCTLFFILSTSWAKNLFHKTQKGSWICCITWDIFLRRHQEKVLTHRTTWVMTFRTTARYRGWPLAFRALVLRCAGHTVVTTLWTANISHTFWKCTMAKKRTLVARCMTRLICRCYHFLRICCYLGALMFLIKGFRLLFA